MNSSARDPVYFDPYKPEIHKNPYPTYRRLREEAPLYYNEQYDFYAVSRYEDVERGLFDHQTFISGYGDILEFIKSRTQQPPGFFIMEDPPIHPAHRSVLMRAFTPRRVSELEPKIRDFCRKCLDGLGGADRMDFIADLGSELPMRVIGMLLGIPEQDLHSVRTKVDDFLATKDGKPMEQTLAFVNEDFGAYIDWRAKHPSDDLMTELLNAEFKDETGTQRKLTRTEILSMVNMLAGAGNETTNKLIGWMAKTLSDHPDQRAQIVKDPALIRPTIEEILRFEPPGPFAARYVTRDVELHGQRVPAGSTMLFIIASANRDDRRFEYGDRFDINRKQVPHITFGNGIHACIGAALARMEGRVVLDEVLKRFPVWEVDEENAELFATSTVRGWATMPAFLNGKRPAQVPKQEIAAAAPVTAESVAGTWNVVIKGPTGPQRTVLKIECSNGKVTGTQVQDDIVTPVMDGKLEGNRITWLNEVTKPMKLKVTFDGTVDGRTMKGNVKAGFIGRFPFTAEKA